MIVNILLGVSVFLNIILLLGVKNLLKQNEQLEDIIIKERERIITRLNNSYRYMKDADLRGSFEADDEVGGAFKEIKSAIEELIKDI